ncbi:AAA family ATPase [Flavobacterium cerinum]|uniref:AAA family ATPase n=1 Tax=Flavobacterium cerinum TaxID=2502784 RepID=A0ABY5ITM2_9FLAO|nr:AAA family ATPase [Flavobacterium cerinum]UUC45093.1 AAA family ATPase [Flavobacterium cerinum]
MPDHFYVITGGPGVGKTTLLEALKQQGYLCIPEIAREIIHEQIQQNGTALPWKDYALYTRLMLERSVNSYCDTIQIYNGTEPVFFDRGIPDTLCYASLTDQPITETMERFINQYRYNTKVFMLPPWKAIYHTDTERKQNWEEAIATYEQMIKTYQQYGYQIIEIPKDSVQNRLAFILHHIS